MFRNRRIRCLVSSVLLVVMFAAFGLVLPTSTVEAKAAPKLSTKSVTLAYGGKKTIKLSNGKGKWTVAGDGVVTVTKQTKTSITVKPVHSGTATIKCRVGKKTLQCKVKVLNNSIGDVMTDFNGAMVVGGYIEYNYTLPRGVTLESTEYDDKVGKVTTKTTINEKNSKMEVYLKVKALKPGSFKLKLNYLNNEEPEDETLEYVFINGFRSSSKVKKTTANYKSWRKKIISSMVSEDMSTWQIIDAIGMLISSGRYSSKGGATGIQLWYGGNGTCVSGAKMMDDFMADLGVYCTVHFAGKDKGPTDIYGYSISYASQHKNNRVKLGGETYELNPQPGVEWPIGTVKR